MNAYGSTVEKGSTESGSPPEIAPDYVGEDQGNGDPMLLVGEPNAGDFMRLVDYLQERYQVDLEYAGEHQQVYTVHPDVDAGGRSQ